MKNIHSGGVTPPRTVCPCGSTRFKRHSDDGFYDECDGCGRRFPVDRDSLASGQDFEKRWSSTGYPDFTNTNIK